MGEKEDELSSSSLSKRATLLPAPTDGEGKGEEKYAEQELVHAATVHHDYKVQEAEDEERQARRRQMDYCRPSSIDGWTCPMTEYGSSVDDVDEMERRVLLNSLIPTWLNNRRLDSAWWDRATLVSMMTMAASALVYSIQNMNVKLAGQYFQFWTVSFFLGWVGTVVAMAHTIVMRTAVDPQARETAAPLFASEWGNVKWLVLRGVLGAITIIASFIAVLKVDLSDATVLIATSTLWTAMMAAIVEKDSWTRGDTFAALLCMGGIALVCRPAFFQELQGSEERGRMAVGMVCALVAAISQAGVNMVIRKIRSEDTRVITLYAMVAILIMTAPGMIYEQQQAWETTPLGGRPSVAWILLCVTGVLSFLAQLLKTFALQISAGVGVLVMRYLETVFSFLWSFTIFHARFNPMSLGGAILIIIGCLTSMFHQDVSRYLRLPITCNRAVAQPPQ